MAKPVAVVTGSSTGIGRETALQFARSGYAVVVNACRNIRGLQETADLIVRESGLDREDLLLVSADITNHTHCQNLVRTAFGWRGHVQVWVNNAGADILTPQMQAASFEQRLQKLFEVDVHGTIRLSRLVADSLVQQDVRGQWLPSIVNCGWDQAFLGMAGDPGQSFCPAKAAVMAFSKSLGLTLAPQVRVNCVAPGWIQTEWGESNASDYWAMRATDESQLNRWGKPSDVAKTTVWLASRDAEFVNGQVIEVNGGRQYYPR